MFWLNIWKKISVTRTSLYLLRFSPDCPNYSRDQIHISIKTHLCENIKTNCLVIFSRNSRVLTLMRIRQKLELQYISSDLGHDCAKYGRIQIHISIGTYLCEHIKRICPVIFSINSRVLTPMRIRHKLELHYICSNSIPTARTMLVTKFISIYIKVSHAWLLQ